MRPDLPLGFALTALALVLLAGCGGRPDPAPASVPPSAAASAPASAPAPAATASAGVAEQTASSIEDSVSAAEQLLNDLDTELQQDAAETG